MKSNIKDCKIVLSDKKLKNLTTLLKVGDHIAISVIRSIGDGRYRIKLQGLELIAVFNGALPSAGVIYAVVQVIEPHIVLKLLIHDATIMKRAESISHIIEASHGSFSLQPFMSETFHRCMDHIRSLREVLKDVKSGEVMRVTLGRIRERIYKSVARIDGSCSDTEFGVDSYLEKMYEACVKNKEELHAAREGLGNKVGYEVLSELTDLSKECDDLILQLILQYDCRHRLKASVPFLYYQIPFQFDGRFVSPEVYFYDNALDCSLDIWLESERATYFAKVAFNKEKRLSVIKELMFTRGTSAELDAVLKQVQFFLGFSGWIVDADSFLRGSEGFVRECPKRPQAVNVRSIQHFTLVA